MKADELMQIATRLANQAFVRYWLHWNYPCEDKWLMAIEVRGRWGRAVEVPDLIKKGFEWDEFDGRHYIERDKEEVDEQVIQQTI